MSGKLDQSLDEIMKDAPKVKRGKNGRPQNRKAAQKSKAATTAIVAPAGGISKKTKAAKPVKTPTAPAPKLTGESKISVSSLPLDITEPLIKDFFQSQAGPVKRVILNYDQRGHSRGSGVVIFAKPDGAALAAKTDGIKVDGKPMRVEVVVGAKEIAPPPPPKALAERVTGPKNAAKEQQKKIAKKEGSKAATNGEAKAKKSKKAGRVSRPKKTAEELDAEMQDYFGSGGDGATGTNGGMQPGAAMNGADTGMVDEVM